MKEVLLVGVGGAIGSMARYKLSGLVLHFAIDWRFPLPTFVVNLAGCLGAGLLWGLAEKHNLLSSSLRLLIFTGLLGGFTTFSAFSLETVYLLRKNEIGIASLYVALSVLCGIAIAWSCIVLWPAQQQVR